MSTTLPLFWHLSSASKKERLDASIKLIGALEQFQSQFVPANDSGATSGSGSDEEEEEEEDKEGPSKSDGLDFLNVQDVSYSIRRLIRGLASPRESSRLGFAVALTELLSRVQTVTCSQIVALIVNGSKIQNSMSGQEERDVLFARLFGLTAVIQSGLVVRTGTLNTSASAAADVSTLSSFEEVIKELLLLGEKKSWLRESAWWTIRLAMDTLKDSQVTWRDDAVPKVMQQLFVDYDIWSPEKVALTLKLQALYPDQDWRKLCSPAFKNPDLLHTGNLQNLARILKESAVEDNDGKDVPKTTAGNWKPQLHFVWDTILEQLLPGQTSSQSLPGSFQEFFRIVVDESLFSSTASVERKYWGFEVFQKALPRVTQDTMPMLFTKNFMRTWINHLSKPDRYLHKIAQKTATDVQAFVQNNPQLGFALILQLTGVNGNHQFDKLTKTKTVDNILTTMDAEGIKNYIEHLLGQMNGPSQTTEDIRLINSRRSWIIEQLGGLIRSGSIPKNDDWVQSILDLLVVHGLFIVKKKDEKSRFLALHSMPNPVFSDELRKSCRTRLLACISDLNTQTSVVKLSEKTSKMSAVASDGEFQGSKKPVDVFVDTIIGFLEKSTAYMRTVGNQVFALLSGAVQESTIDLIVTQLERRDPAELLKDANEDVEMEDIDENEQDSEDSDDESDEADAGDEGDGDSNDEEEDVVLRRKIEEALRVNGIEAATGDSDEEEELMDDDQMMAIDEQLAAVFKTRANEKKIGKGEFIVRFNLHRSHEVIDVDVQREATHFKNRVLDLVDTFVKKQPSSPLILRLLSPLIDLVSGTGLDERQLSDKAKSILRSRITKSKDIPQDIKSELALTIASDVHTRARKVHSSDILATLSQCSLYLFRVLAHSQSEEPLIQLYQESLADFLTRKNSALNSTFFQDFIRRHSPSAWALRNDLLDLSGRAVNAYRQGQAYQLLETLMSQLPAMENVNSSEVAEFTSRLQEVLLEVVTDACTDKKSLSAAQLKEVLKLALVAARQNHRVNRASHTEIWQPDSWYSLAGRLSSSERFKKSTGLPKMCEQLGRISNPGDVSLAKVDASAPKMKRKAEESFEMTDTSNATNATKKLKRKRAKADKT
ncbi:hypothetical protein C0993_005605 [Termitomyces sp. T159_Od127]|nr:hypothetical protein C0993_005605 [Termitomyces sp. T159_Od127]